jgi:hypothetical protein
LIFFTGKSYKRHRCFSVSCLAVDDHIITVTELLATYLVNGPQGHPYRALTVVDFTRLLGLARRGVAAEQQGWVERTKERGLENER